MGLIVQSARAVFPKEFAVKNARWLAPLLFLGTTAGYAQVIGAVVNTQGTWCDAGHQECHSQDFRGLWRMYPIRRDSRLIRVGRTTGRESIVIRSRSGALESFDCSKPRELGCKDPLDLDRLVPAVSEKNAITAFLDAVLQLAADRPKIYDDFSQGIVTRGSDWHPLSDAVVELREGGGLDLQNVLDSLETGEYWLQLCRLDDSDRTGCSDVTVPIKYSWNPKKPVSFPTVNLNPGLYRIYVCEVNSSVPVKTRKYAEILVAEQPRAQQLANDFRQVVNATQPWDKTDPTAPALRRAYLYVLDSR
jgi:hypothetical protein